MSFGAGNWKEISRLNPEERSASTEEYFCFKKVNYLMYLMFNLVLFDVLNATKSIVCRSIIRFAIITSEKPFGPGCIEC